jgi:hypothetical protein
MLAMQDDAPLWRPNMTFANAAEPNLFVERALERSETVLR